ncbi:hypothetical protein AAU57_14390 [Nonlabens sp. YIK11]|uniref:hypothetical protein n=1 Tax=Nonlabens sp. YIK11 TaxID=1453349 RepID=UPI0006DC355A|nr:hypothetical protein [Nonlabens sp. YIK11]KQC34395.1 hypothetical protein AAU57_14390 [Nonlabens sp. YIK11]
MADQLYLEDFDYFKGAKVLHYFEFLEPQKVKDEYFVEHDVHALTICDYDGEETMLFYFDDDLEVIMEFEFMIPSQAKEKAAEDFHGIDIQWKNK